MVITSVQSSQCWPGVTPTPQHPHHRPLLLENLCSIWGTTSWKEQLLCPTATSLFSARAIFVFARFQSRGEPNKWVKNKQWLRRLMQVAWGCFFFTPASQQVNSQSSASEYWIIHFSATKVHFFRREFCYFSTPSISSEGTTPSEGISRWVSDCPKLLFTQIHSNSMVPLALNANKGQRITTGQLKMSFSHWFMKKKTTVCLPECLFSLWLQEGTSTHLWLCFKRKRSPGFHSFMDQTCTLCCIIY